MLHNRIRRCTLWCVAFLAPMAPLMGQTDETLKAEVLESLFADSSETVALDINDRGQIVGSSTNAAGRSRATLWENQAKPRPLECYEGTTDCSAVAINNRGTTVGNATPADHSVEYEFIVRWSPSGEVSRATTPRGFVEASANGISDQGFVVGSAREYEFSAYGGPATATLWLRNGKPTQKLQRLPSFDTRPWSEALAVNSNRRSIRQIVGVSAYQDRNVAAAWDRRGRPTALHPLSHDDRSIAYGVNRAGTVAGISYDNSTYSAVVWKANGRPVALNPLAGCEQSAAVDINNAGFVVGHNFACAGRSESVAVIWSPEGEVFKLPLPARFVEGGAAAINSRGDVVGWATNRQGKTVAIVWR